MTDTRTEHTPSKQRYITVPRPRMKTFTVEVAQVVQAYTVAPVTGESTFDELGLGDVERDGIALDLENHLGIHVCDKDARAWMSVGDVVRTVEAKRAVREAMA